MSIIIGIDHGYYAIKTAHCSFPAGLTSYGEQEPYRLLRPLRSEDVRLYAHRPLQIGGW